MLGFNGGIIGIANTVFTGTKSNDPNYADNVSLLLNGNGTNGSTTFTDSSSYGHTVTPVGDAQISDAQSKFGVSSMYFDGNGDYIYIGNPSSSLIEWYNGDFTIESWIYMTAAPTNGSSITPMVGHGNVSSSVIYWSFGPKNDRTIQFYYWSGTQNSFTTTSTVPLTTWTHIAFVKNGTNLKIYIDGTESNSTTLSVTPQSQSSGNYLSVGRVSNQGGFNGYIDDLRITKGVARYTDSFTPPTAQLPGGETGTFASGLWTSSDYIKQIRNELWPRLIVTDGLVLHLDAGDSASYPGSGPGSGTTWYDLSGNGNDGTINGATYSSADGGYFSFDGSNDRGNFTTPITSTSNQTYEIWTNAIASASASGGYAYIMHNNSLDNSTGRSYLTIGIKLTQQYFAAFNGAYSTMDLGVTANTSNILQIVLTWDGSTQKAYANSVLKDSQALTGTPQNFDTTTGFGDYKSSTFRMIQGNIYSIKVYNKALTQSEITQNFDAIKGRYGL